MHSQGQILALLSSDGIGKNEGKLFPVHIKLSLDNELALNLFIVMLTLRVMKQHSV